MILPTSIPWWSCSTIPGQPDPPPQEFKAFPSYMVCALCDTGERRMPEQACWCCGSYAA